MLVQIPNGSWIDPARVLSVGGENTWVEIAMEGENTIVVDVNSPVQAKAFRDCVARSVNDAIAGKVPSVNTRAGRLGAKAGVLEAERNRIAERLTAMIFDDTEDDIDAGQVEKLAHNRAIRSAIDVAMDMEDDEEAR